MLYYIVHLQNGPINYLIQLTHKIFQIGMTQPITHATSLERWCSTTMLFQRWNDALCLLERLAFNQLYIRNILSYCFHLYFTIIIFISIYNDFNEEVYKLNSNMTSFFRFVNNRASYRLGIISLAHAPVHVTDFSVINVHVDELSSARI